MSGRGDQEELGENIWLNVRRRTEKRERERERTKMSQIPRTFNRKPKEKSKRSSDCG